MIGDRVTAFELDGELDARSSGALQAALNDAIDKGADRLLLDLSGLSLCDSTGLQAIVASYHRVTMAGGRLAIVCDDPRILRVFAITRLDRLLGVATTRAEALSLLEPASPPSRLRQGLRRLSPRPSARRASTLGPGTA